MTAHRLRNGLGQAGLVVLAVIFLFPVYLLIIVSLQPRGTVAGESLLPPADPQWSNYIDAFLNVSSGTLGQSLLSSTMMTVASVLILVVIGSMAGYAVVRIPGPRTSNAMYAFFIAGLTIPVQLGMVSAYAFVNAIGLSGTFIAMVLLYVALFLPMTVFLYAGFARAIPSDYEEAASLDGAGTIRTFFAVVFPLLRPATGAVAVLMSLNVWNEFFAPLVFLTGSPFQPTPVFIYAMVGEYASDWQMIFASVVLALLPVFAFFLIAQRRLIKGIAGGLKG